MYYYNNNKYISNEMIDHIFMYVKNVIQYYYITLLPDSKRVIKKVKYCWIFM